MHHHMIEETIRSIRPKQRGVPAAAPISVSSVTGGESFAGSLSQAAQEIAQLRQVYQAQANLIAANTQAVEKNNSGSTGSSGGGVLSSLESVAGKILGGGLFGLTSLISGISDLFGGGHSTPAPLPLYVPPPSIQLDSTIRNTIPSGGVNEGNSGQSIPPMMSSSLAPVSSISSVARSGDGVSNVSSPGSSNGAVNYQPQVTVQIQALDSRSIMDRSSDIADAVREAVLNLHPITNVLGDK